MKFTVCLPCSTLFKYCSDACSESPIPVILAETKDEPIIWNDIVDLNPLNKAADGGRSDQSIQLRIAFQEFSPCSMGSFGIFGESRLY